MLSCEGPEVFEDGGVNYAYKRNFRTALPQLIAVSVKNLLLLAYGMTLGFVTILIPALTNPTKSTGETLHLNSEEISWIASLNLIVVPLGCALSGLVTHPLGRRRSMQLVNIPFFIAWLMLYRAQSSVYIYIALGLTGIAGGLLEAPVLTYVAEVTQPHLRGFLTASSSMTIIIGVFTQFLFGLIFYWRIVTLFNIAFTVLAMLALCFIPESPHWLVSKNRLDEATKSLQWLRGWTTSDAVQAELDEIKKLYVAKSGAHSGAAATTEGFLQTLQHYTEGGFLKPYLLVSFSFFVGHFCGMTSLQTYALEIFERLKTPIDRYYATLILGSVQIAGSLACVILVHYTGKRPLTFLSLVGAATCCAVVAGYDIYINDKLEKVPGGIAITKGSDPSGNFNETLSDLTNGQEQYSWVPLTSLMLLACLSHMGIRLLPWILIGEVFSAKTRSGASGLSSATGYIYAFLSNKFFTSMLNTMDIKGTYGFYAVVSITGALILYFILPETEGKALIDIENHFAGIKMINNKVHRSKRIKDLTVEKLPKQVSDKTLEMNSLKNGNGLSTLPQCCSSSSRTHVNLGFDSESERGKIVCSASKQDTEEATQL